MPSSAARIAANRRNAQKSTGPTTPEGKEAVRANALKHGLTGAGVVVPAADAAAVEALAGELEAELAPAGSAAGRVLARRAAALAVRLERIERHEDAMTDDRVRNAPEAFDEARHAAAEHLWATIEQQPATHARRLRATAEGLDLLDGQLAELRGAIARGAVAWSAALAARFDLLTGRNPADPVASFCRIYTAALLADDPAALEDGDLAGWHAWAAGEILGLIDREQADLDEARAAIDHAREAQSRAEAGARALIDASPKATRRRRYEVSSERTLLRTFAELRSLRHEAAAEAVGPIPPGAARPPRPAPISRTAPAPAPVTARPVALFSPRAAAPAQPSSSPPATSAPASPTTPRAAEAPVAPRPERRPIPPP